MKPHRIGERPAALDRARIGTAARIEQMVEGGEVGRHRRQVQPDRVAVGDEDRARCHPGRLELMAQRGQRLTQVLAPGVGIGIRPEEIDQHLARMRTVRVAGEIGEESRHLPRAEAGHDVGAAACREAAEGAECARGLRFVRGPLGCAAAGRPLPDRRRAHPLHGADFPTFPPLAYGSTTRRGG